MVIPSAADFRALRRAAPRPGHQFGEPAYLAIATWVTVCSVPWWLMAMAREAAAARARRSGGRSHASSIETYVGEPSTRCRHCEAERGEPRLIMMLRLASRIMAARRRGWLIQHDMDSRSKTLLRRRHRPEARTAMYPC